VALSATGHAVRPISQPGSLFRGRRALLHTESINLIRSKDLGMGVARALGSCKAVLLRNHGVAIVGGTIEEATILTIMLDNACQIQLLCEAAGGVGEEFPAEDVERHARHHQPLRAIPDQLRVSAPQDPARKCGEIDRGTHECQSFIDHHRPRCRCARRTPMPPNRPRHAHPSRDGAYQGADREQKLLAGAKAEGGEVSVYHVYPALTSVLSAFTTKYGIKAKAWRSGSEGVLQKLVSEARGKPLRRGPGAEQRAGKRSRAPREAAAAG
jgi:hypothetical protein